MNYQHMWTPPGGRNCQTKGLEHVLLISRWNIIFMKATRQSYIIFFYKYTISDHVKIHQGGWKECGWLGRNSVHGENVYFEILFRVLRSSQCAEIANHLPLAVIIEGLQPSVTIRPSLVTVSPPTQSGSIRSEDCRWKILPKNITRKGLA